MAMIDRYANATFQILTKTLGDRGIYSYTYNSSAASNKCRFTRRRDFIAAITTGDVETWTLICDGNVSITANDQIVVFDPNSVNLGTFKVSATNEGQTLTRKTIVKQFNCTRVHTNPVS